MIDLKIQIRVAMTRLLSNLIPKLALGVDAFLDCFPVYLYIVPNGFVSFQEVDPLDVEERKT